ncbi:hypothetical protein [Conchiformibius kuhniae]|uniref:Uncharacterized protein n=1 Tax=Conchiformibius kuhniae TaxID=211502 RepID=A0A8T9MW03_9NEIS|nr:hypothetical protein [Conchiformibius kuhniae]UOP04352.1 hypothetical protein LVJ77_08370 [Conchiformibius kuhniae]
MRRHSRAGGNPKQISKSIDKTSLHKHQVVDSRLRGNDGVFVWLIKIATMRRCQRPDVLTRTRRALLPCLVLIFINYIMLIFCIKI